MTDLITQRADLTNALADCEPGAFPGSAESRRESAAMRALIDFDAAHPNMAAAAVAQNTGYTHTDGSGQ